MGVTLNKRLRQENTEADREKRKKSHPCDLSLLHQNNNIREAANQTTGAAVAIIAKNIEKPRVFSGSLFAQRCSSSGGTPPSNSITHSLDRISLDGAF